MLLLRFPALGRPALLLLLAVAGAVSCGDSGDDGGATSAAGGEAGETTEPDGGDGASTGTVGGAPGGHGGTAAGGAPKGGDGSRAGAPASGGSPEAPLGGAAGDTSSGGAPAGNDTGPELIAAALSEGRLSAERALVYEVYSVFGDARLPAAYRGDNSNLLESDVLSRVWQRFDELSSEAQGLLTPFLQRPSEPGSWANGATLAPRQRAPREPARRIFSFCRQEADANWKSVTTPSANVQVWYDHRVTGQLAAAQQLFDAVETYAWPKLIGAGGLDLKAPPSDLDPETNLDCAGQDSRLDIYLTDLGVWGLTDARNGWDRATNCHGPFPTVITINRNLSTSNQIATAVHELMHAIQFSYPTKSCQEDYGFLRDGTAQWAIDHVLSGTPLDAQQEHPWSDCFTTSPEKNLEDRSAGSCVERGASTARDYGSYLFFQYLSRTGSPALVKAIVEGMATASTALEAIDAAWGGKLRENWLGFSRALLNDVAVTPLTPTFKNWDNLVDIPRLELNETLQNVTRKRFDLRASINHLSTHLYRFRFADVQARSLLLRNGFFQAQKDGKAVKLKALFKNSAGAWQEEDWTPYKFVGLCRDRLAARTDELILIVSNGEWQSGGGGKLDTTDAFYLEATNIGCWRYTGDVTCTFEGAVSGGNATTVESTLSFVQDPRIDQAVPPTHPQVPDSLRAGVQLLVPLQASGTFELHASRSGGECPFTFQTTSAIGISEPGVLQLNAFPGLELSPTAGDLLSLIAQQPGYYRVNAGTLQSFTAQPAGADCDPEPIVVPTLGSSGDSPTNLVKPNGDIELPNTTFKCAGTLRPALE